ncbi:MAG: MBL fold metallo-hydrolase [Gammaproteobacteria bacterium]|nr:MBL fold metallo-hydrolase [Gammaproteobacteria bacterium]
MIRKMLMSFTGLMLMSMCIAQTEDVQITSTKLSETLSMLQGRGGNIGVLTGADGVILIDDQYAPMSARILDAVEAISKEPVRFVINTHWHSDHTGGNENFGGKGALIVAHDNVRRRLSTDQVIKALGRPVPAAPEQAWPVITFSQNLTMHLNGEEIRILHQPRAHTDGDAILYFVNSNVIHAGDVFFNGMYPFIDTSTGGSLNGVIGAVERILALADDNTRIIPGHGPLADKSDLVAYHAMLTTVRERIIAYLNQGMTATGIEIRDPLKDFNKKWGQGFMRPDVWLRIAIEDLAEK